MSHLIDTLITYHAGRDPERLALKYELMRKDAFAFLRGTCHLFNARMPEDKSLYKAPLAWTCGDLHLENFGSYKGDNRLVYFDLNDFDEATLAPSGWSLVRFVASVLLAAPSLKFKHDEALEHAQAFIDAYATALASGKAGWLERDTAQGLIREHLEDLGRCSRKELLDSRTEPHGKRRRLRVDGDKALPATDKQREQVKTLIGEFADKQEQAEFFEVLDVARRVSGNASLGLERFAILVRGGGNPDKNYLLDLKATQPSSLTPWLKTPAPHWASEAERVICVQQMMQAVSTAFLHPMTLGRHSCVLRELQPAQDRIDLSACAGKSKQFRELVTQMGQLVAWGQLRSSGRKGAANADELIEFALRNKWRSRTINLAQACAEQAEADWKHYAEAYDEGVFRL